MAKPGMLIHICCAPCSTHVMKELAHRFEIKGFFYGPNIHPREEYQTRLHEARRLAEVYGFQLIIGEHDEELWHERIAGLEIEEEGGARCSVCYRMRLERTAEAARDEGVGWFATTLTVSPHKKAVLINPMGLEEGERRGIEFYPADFKKNDGFGKSSRLSRELGLYRQNYCGCIYSISRGKGIAKTGNLSGPGPHGNGDDYRS